MPVDVGQAVADYCRRGRPRNGHRALFVHARAPYAPLSSDAITQVVVQASRRAGLAPVGAHRLRHSSASAMRRAGAPLFEIGQILRHRWAVTTALYAKDDLGALVNIARRWPGESAMSRLHQATANYLAVRRALGFKLRGHDRLLADFLDELERSGATTITVSGAVAWATAPADISPVRWSQRLSVVRGFARHLQCLDPLTEVPPDDVLACRRHRPTAYLYSEDDIARLLQAAAALRPALRGATHEAFFGLLAVTGMRIGEAIGLDRCDVDLEAGVVQINEAKFRKHRRVPLHDSTVAALRRYAEVRDELCPTPKAPSFFVSTRGTRLIDTCVHSVFNRLVDAAGLEPQPGAERAPGPRPATQLRGRHRAGLASAREPTRPGSWRCCPRSSATQTRPTPTGICRPARSCSALAAERLDRWEADRR